MRQRGAFSQSVELLPTGPSSSMNSNVVASSNGSDVDGRYEYEYESQSQSQSQSLLNNAYTASYAGPGSSSATAAAASTTDDADAAAGRLTTGSSMSNHSHIGLKNGDKNPISSSRAPQHQHVASHSNDPPQQTQTPYAPLPQQQHVLLPHHFTNSDINSNSHNHHNNNNNHEILLNLHSLPSSATLSSLETAPNSGCTFNTVNSINTVKGHPTDLEFFEDLITEPVLVLGVDISHLSPSSQFATCACGLFAFSLLYGYLQELLSVELCSRKLGLFLALTQFAGYTVLAFFMRQFVYAKQQTYKQRHQLQQDKLAAAHAHAVQNGDGRSLDVSLPPPASAGDSVASASKSKPLFDAKHVPLALYLGLSLLRAIDLAMTNLAMQYINYPAKTLMKSSRVVFTMLFGVLIQRKVYKPTDYAIVIAMVVGLAMFMHADANSSAVFHHMGVIMLTISLVCDGTISNMSETIMSQFGVGQDEFIFRLYSISLMAIAAAATIQGDLWTGLLWMAEPGTYQQFLDQTPLHERSWSVSGKIAVMILFSTMGFFGSSTSAAITKNFGALTMSITSTARKATTLFLSFFLFNNVCTAEHVAGMAVFIAALTTKSLRRRNHSDKHKKKEKRSRRQVKRKQSSNHAHAAPAIVNIRSHSESTPERLTFRHVRGNSNDNMEAASVHTNINAGNNNRNLVHIV